MVLPSGLKSTLVQVVSDVSMSIDDHSPQGAFTSHFFSSFLSLSSLFSSFEACLFSSALDASAPERARGAEKEVARKSRQITGIDRRMNRGLMGRISCGGRQRRRERCSFKRELRVLRERSAKVAQSGTRDRRRRRQCAFRRSRTGASHRESRGFPTGRYYRRCPWEKVFEAGLSVSTYS